MFGFKFLGNTHIPHRKNTAAMPAVRMTPPSEVLLPMVQHIGAPATPIVKVGDVVKVGQKIAEASGYVSSPVYASISGKVAKIENYLRPDGRMVPAIRITSDGEMALLEGIAPPAVTDFDSFAAAVRESGLVGLGGAGFPTAVKLDAVKKGMINTVVINGAECEPYITCDTRTMIERMYSIERAVAMCVRYLGIKKVIIAIERNKPEAIEKMKIICKRMPEVSVKTLASSYPQGGEKVLIYNTTGKIVPPGKLPIDVGCIVCNCTTMATIADYVETGMPLVEKYITVDGGAVKKPGNYVFPIGTTFEYIFNTIGGFSKQPEKVLYGGPMMGIAVPNLSVPVLKNTNAILALDEKQSRMPTATSCIRCGNCVNCCPIGLRSTDIGTAYRGRDGEALKKLNVLVCMECGCCAYVCPAKRPLVQTNRLAKGLLREHLAKEKKAREEAEALAGNKK